MPLESSGFRKCSTLLVIQLFSPRLCLCHCLCIRLCLCICVPYSFLISYYHKLSENVWVWGSGAYFYRIEFQARGAPHVHMLYWLLLGGTESVWVGTGWYLVVLGQYNWVPLGIKWNLVSVGLLCLYILKNMEIYSDVTIAGRKRKDSATQPKHYRLSNEN